MNRPPDDPALHLLLQLATQDLPFSTALPQDKLSVLERTISAAPWEIAVQVAPVPACQHGLSRAAQTLCNPDWTFSAGWKHGKQSGQETLS